MSHKMLIPFIVKVSVFGYFPLHIGIYRLMYSYCKDADYIYYSGRTRTLYIV